MITVTATELKNDLSKYLYASMAETALTNEIDAIVARDPGGFSGIRTPVYSPEDFIERHLGDRMKELDEMMAEAMNDKSDFTV